MNVQRIAIYIFSFLLLILFENCRYQPSSTPQENSSKMDPALDFGTTSGQPYDGKPFYNSDEKCNDGTVISSRILVNKDKLFLVRNHCQDIAPVAINPDQVKNDGNGATLSLSYNGVSYQKELGPLQIPLLTSFYTQLTGNLNTNTGASVYVVDLFETSTTTIESLKSKGIKVVCNFSAGTWEAWAPDQNEFPKSAIGNTNGSNDERYVNIASPQVRTIMLKRLDLARQKGCLGVDMDNMDGYGNNTGFNITTRLQIEYNSILAYAAHDRKLFAGFHNAVEIIPALVNSFDFAYAEECFSYNECSSFQPFTQNNKPTFITEYKPLNNNLCSMAESLGISLSYHSSELDGSAYESCTVP